MEAASEVENPFAPLWDGFPTELCEEVCMMFDNAPDALGSGLQLPALAMFLCCLENMPDDRAAYNVAFLRNYQALQAAYELGKKDASSTH